MTNVKKFEGSPTIKKLYIVLIIAGAATFAIGVAKDPVRLWANYLMNYFFWMNIGLFGLFFAALQHITSSYWSATLRRVAESFSAYLPISALLFIGLLFGMHHLFEWTHHDAVEADHLLNIKSAYLNIPFFIARHVALYAVAIFLGGKLIKNSLSQDKLADASISLKNATLSAPFIMLFAIFYTLASVDLMMSLAPHWFSTIFGVYCWAGLMNSGFGMLAIWVVHLRRKGVLAGLVTEDHLHDVGKLMFAFMVFWAYVAFSQYMLIWYANLPEETPYMILRTQGDYQALSIVLMLVKFVLPMFMLISRPSKRNANWLMFMGFWFILAQWLDTYWIVMPTFYDKPVFGFPEIGMFLGFLGLFFLSVSTYLQKISPVAINDPWQKDALHHHQ